MGPPQCISKIIRVNNNKKNEFIEPLPIEELIRATKSAEKAWRAKNNQQANEEARKKGYLGAGYNLTNQTIIQWLDINQKSKYILKPLLIAKKSEDESVSEIKMVSGKRKER